MADHDGDRGVDTGIARHGKLSYMQIPAAEPMALGHFYTTVFGWECGTGTDHVSFRDATGELIGAFVSSLPPATEGGVLPYVSVRDVAAALTLIVANGGTVVRDAYAEEALTVATFRDPAGNMLGVWQS